MYQEINKSSNGNITLAPNPFDLPPYKDKLNITQYYDYIMTDVHLKQGYFLNKNMTLISLEMGVYKFSNLLKNIHISFNCFNNSLIISIEDRTLFDGKIKTEKEMEVLLDQLSIKL